MVIAAVDPEIIPVPAPPLVFAFDRTPEDGVDDGFDDPDGVEYDILWKFNAFGSVEATPVIVDGLAVVPVNSGGTSTVYALNYRDGSTVWSTAIGSGVKSSAAIQDGRIVFGAEDGNVYCLDEDDGTVLWKTSIGGILVVPVRGSPAVANGGVYVGADDDRLHALRLTDGTGIWQFPTGGDVRSSPEVGDVDGDGNPDAPGNRDDFYDFKYGEDHNFNGILDPGEDRNGNGVIDTYFSFGRQNIFHYALFTHETESWWLNQWFRNAAGWGEQGVPGLWEGNDFIVTKRASSQASVFMHELGHNLGLPHSSGNTAMTGEESGIVDYLPSEWSALNLALVVGGD